MKFLAWDTSAKVGSIAALEWNGTEPKLVSEWVLDVNAVHSERLLWAIHQVLDSASWSLKDIDVFSVGVGPGSFTGLRIAITTARALAHAENKPLIGVSSLAALTRPVAEWLAPQSRMRKSRTLLIGATDACKGELFAIVGNSRSVLECSVHGAHWKSGVEEKVVTPKELKKWVSRKLIEAGKSAQWLAVGEGRLRYPELWESLGSRKEQILPTHFSQFVQARYVGLLGWEAFQGGLRTSALEVSPRYLRASNAELNLKR